MKEEGRNNPGDTSATRSLERVWNALVMGLGVIVLAGKLIGPLQGHYPFPKFHVLFFLVAAAVIFFVIPESRKAIFARYPRQKALKSASILTWALAECIALLGLTAYLMAGDDPTFFGLVIGAFLVLFNFRPGRMKKG